MDIEIKLAVAADAPALSQILANSWKHAYAGIVSAEFLDSLKGDEWVGIFTEWMDNGIADILIASVDGVYVGCASYGASRSDPRKDEMHGCGEIAIMYLLPEYIGKGIGHALIQAALEKLANAFDKCHLWVLRENQHARAFYESHGFVNSGRELEVEIAGGKFVNCHYTRTLT